MYEGKERTYYQGLPLGNGQFLLAAFVTELTAPDEPPYLTHQMRFDATDGYLDDLWFADDYITAYAAPQKPTALSREGRLFNALTGDELADLDPRVTTHFNTIDADQTTWLVAGDNGRFWAGPRDDMAYLDNTIHRPIPAPTSPLEEKIAWGQGMQQAFASHVIGPQDFLIGGARGFLTRYRSGAFTAISLGIEAHVTGIAPQGDDTFAICGHSPNSFVGVLDGNDVVTLTTVQQNGARLHSPCVFQGRLFVGASDVAGGLFTVDDSGLVPFDIPNAETFGALRHLDVDDTRLWAVFERALVVIDGDTFRVHQHPSDL